MVILKGTDRCGSGMSPCNDGRCIPSGWLCDGQRDCATGEDEQNCSKWLNNVNFSQFINEF